MRSCFQVAVAVTFAATMLSCSTGRVAPTQKRTTEETVVLQAVQRFFDTMASRDSVGASTVLDPMGDFVSVSSDGSGKRMVLRSSIAGYLAGLKRGTASYRERMWDAEVRIRGPIAVVWAPYDFHIGGKFSHCGVDIFDLVEKEAGWVITGATYTVERTGCSESPLGPP